VKRHRDVAAAPVRSPSETWRTISELVVATLERSPDIQRAEAEDAMAAAEPAGLALIAGGHLDRHPITLIAGTVDCTIGTVTGTRAFDVDENLNPVPGAGTATEFAVHLPTPEPHDRLVRRVADLHPRLSSEQPGAPVQEASARSGPIIDLAALERLRD